MNKHFQYGFSFAFFRFVSAFNNSITHLRKLIRSRTDECMTETGKFSLIFRCHASLVTSETWIIPRGDLICTRDNSAITVFSASFFPNRRNLNAKQVKGSYTQNSNRLQKEFFIPCEVFRNERERRGRGYPEENCRYVSFPSGKRALVGFIKTRIRPRCLLLKTYGTA